MQPSTLNKELLERNKNTKKSKWKQKIEEAEDELIEDDGQQTRTGGSSRRRLGADA